MSYKRKRLLRAYTRPRKVARPLPPPLYAFPAGPAMRPVAFYGRKATRGAELKFFDTALAFSFDLTGEVPATGQLVLIPQGVTESTRVGRKCVVQSITMRGVSLLQPAAAAQTATTVVMMLVQDRQCNGAAAGATDVMTSTNFTSAFRNLSNSSRFKILKKWRWNYNPAAGISTAFSNTIKSFDWSRKLNVPLEFSSTTGAITELKSNNLFLLAGADGNSDDLVTVQGNCRVRFSDG